ncbi:unnamed protein product [Agarophyton chilense]|eukprot:gb/GEZJ01003853.1/.p1 GENE.gb/GEZJ01003853.1/~~gb/GEZJ01003853.1/.p1  ORF type:complete len:661 (-),score=53.48 gb/GEZJ01003853.1/:668-2650(-)
MSGELSPAPLQVGDYVMAPLLASPHPPSTRSVLARVVQLNNQYKQAAAAHALATSKPAFFPIDLSAPAPLWLPANPVPIVPSHPVPRGLAYISFVGLDKRLDRWARPQELFRATPAQVNAVKQRNTLSSSSEPEVKLTRARRRAKAASNPISEDLCVQDLAQMHREQLKEVKIKNISKVMLWPYYIDAWYHSPFPLPHNARKLYICDKCLHYVYAKRDLFHHLSACAWETPPGSLLYEDKDHGISVYEIDSIVSMRYCQALCLLAKLFLDHKTLFCDVTPFLFYVITHKGELAGFFSKEHPTIRSDFNVACILTLPPHQKKGIGKFLIALSYELTRREGKVAGPEHPLSDLGQLSYRSYWKNAIIRFLSNRYERSSSCAKISVNEISQATGIRNDDVVLTLKDIKLYSLWKGEQFADASRISVEQVKKGIKQGRLPFFRERLRHSVFVSEGSSSPLRTSGPKQISCKRPKRPKTPKQRQEVTNLVQHSPGKERNTPSGQRTSRCKISGASAPHPDFNRLQTQRLNMFIQTHSPERVFEAMDVCGRSLDLKKYIHALAKELSLDYDSVCRRLVNMTASMLKSKPPPFATSRRLRNGISKPHKSQNGIKGNGKVKHLGCRDMQTLPNDFMLVGGRRGASHSGYSASKQDSDIVYIASQSSDD